MKQTELDVETIQSRAKADAARIRAAYRRRGRQQIGKGKATPAQVKAYLDALRGILGEPEGKIGKATERT